MQLRRRRIVHENEAGTSTPIVGRGLHLDPAADIFLGHSPADCSFDTKLLRRLDHDLHPSGAKQVGTHRQLNGHQRSRRIGDHLTDSVRDRGMGHALENSQLVDVLEHDVCQASPVDSAILDGRRPAAGNRFVGGTFRLEHLVADLVGLDDLTTELPQPGDNSRLSRADAARNDETNRRPLDPRCVHDATVP